MRERGIVKSRGANVLSLLARLLTHNPLGPYNYFEAICVEVIGLCEKSINVLLLIKRREGKKEEKGLEDKEDVFLDLPVWEVSVCDHLILLLWVLWLGSTSCWETAKQNIPCIMAGA